MLTRGRRLLRDIPTDCLRILTGSFGLTAWFCADWVFNHSAPGWVVAVLVASLIPTVIAGAAWMVRNYRAPDRLAIQWSWDNRLWFIGLAMVVAATVGGVTQIFTGGLAGLLAGGAMVVVGSGILLLVVRHVRKPIRPPDPIVRRHDPCESEPPRPGWRQFR